MLRKKLDDSLVMPVTALYI